MGCSWVWLGFGFDGFGSNGFQDWFVLGWSVVMICWWVDLWLMVCFGWCWVCFFFFFWWWWIWWVWAWLGLWLMMVEVVIDGGHGLMAWVQRWRSTRSWRDRRGCAVTVWLIVLWWCGWLVGLLMVEWSCFMWERSEDIFILFYIILMCSMVE